ncbi:hypothetical protein HPB48_016798 [Haemaphysalis longicornis]|uniref:Citrate transporter-like domain-containing protein n=1 Tax=Haemaphysalis longicornis TaxID=44386 RepID=A0A9J6GP67_HAELO|nr:hypothetical protein HPB48_016798 [Haemaphysalis longicornis]
MLVTTFLSMWMPNIAAASIMLPIAMAMVDQIRDSSEITSTSQPARLRDPCSSDTDGQRQRKGNRCDKEDSKRIRLLRTTMVLGVAYSSSIGGTGTLIGTAPNLVLKGVIDE